MNGKKIFHISHILIKHIARNSIKDEEKEKKRKFATNSIIEV